MTAGPLMENAGATGGLALFDLPPMLPILQVTCNHFTFPAGQDAPCNHGVYSTYGIFKDNELGGVGDSFNYSASNHLFTFLTPTSAVPGPLTGGVNVQTSPLTGFALGINGTWGGISIQEFLLTEALGHNYISWGNGNIGDSTGSIGAGTYAAGTILAGASIPNTPNVSIGGTAGTTTYTYVCTAVSPSGGETLPTAAGTITVGNATLNATNYNHIVCIGNVGDQTMNVYRTSTTGGLSAGRICSGVLPDRNDESCNDTGQAAGAAVPTTDTSGKFIVAGNTFTGVQGNASKIAVASGTFTANNVRVSDASGNEIDGGVAVSGLCQTNGTGCPTGIANVQIVLPTSTLAANTCSTVITTTMTGVTTTSTFTSSFASDASGVTGYGSSGGLSIIMWPTANTNNLKLCNPTAASITPGAMTINVGAK